MALNICTLTDTDHDRYLLEWTAVQSRFDHEPGQAIVEADHLIMQVMQLRVYPFFNFAQRAADKQGLRQAMMYYRSLFEDFLGTDALVVKEK